MARYKVYHTNRHGRRCDYLMWSDSKDEVLRDAREFNHDSTNFYAEVDEEDDEWTAADEAGMEDFEEKRRERIALANEY